MVYSVLGTVGPRAAAAPVALSLGNAISPVKQPTTRLKFAWLASVSGTCHVELEDLSDLNNTKSKISPTRSHTYRIRFLRFNSKQTSKCLMGDSLFDQSDANEISRKRDGRSILKKNAVRLALTILHARWREN